MITILSTPAQWQPIYSTDGNNLSYILESDNAALCSFKYVAEVTINGSTILSPVEKSPDLENLKCVFSIHKLLENHLTFDTYGTSSNWKICGNSKVDYFVRFGEKSDGTFGCTGNSFTTQWGPTHSGIAFNGTLQYEEQTFALSQWNVGQTNQNARFLTNAPQTLNLHLDDYDRVLYYISPNSIPATSGAGSDHCLEVKVTKKNGDVNNFYVMNNNASPANVILAIGVSPNKINSYVTQNLVYSESEVLQTLPIIDCDTDYYDVRITDFTPVG